MKTLLFKMKDGRLVATFLLALVILSGCGNATENQETITSNIPAEKLPAKSPNMDVHAAAFMGNIAMLQQHISAGTDLDKKDAYGSTPLMTASLFGKTNAVRVLLEGGASVDLINNEGSTALHTAAFFCRPEIVDLLLEHGADKNIRNNYGSTPYESVAGPFADVKPIYVQLAKDLGPLGLKLDYDYLEITRPQIAEQLR